jgi:hypothetical protein
MRTEQLKQAGERTQLSRTTYEVEVTPERLSDGSMVFNVQIQDWTTEALVSVPCRDEYHAYRLATKLNEALSEAI